MRRREAFGHIAKLFWYCVTECWYLQDLKYPHINLADSTDTDLMNHYMHYFVIVFLIELLNVFIEIYNILIFFILSRNNVNMCQNENI